MEEPKVKRTKTHKWCPMCKRMLTVGHFYYKHRNDNYDGFTGREDYCKECCKKKQLEIKKKRELDGEFYKKNLEYYETHKDELRYCPKCKQSLKLSEFYKNKEHICSSYCKKCTKESATARYLKRKEHLNKMMTGEEEVL